MAAYLALGSNLGDRWSHLAGALAALRGLDADLEVSPVFETDPVGGPSGQGPYLNCVVRLETAASPRQLLEWCARLEHEAGRVRTEHWGPRPLDVDIIVIDGVEVHEPDLEVPHPRYLERDFVLLPLAALAPELTAGRLASGAAKAPGVRRVGELVRSPDACTTGT